MIGNVYFRELLNQFKGICYDVKTFNDLLCKKVGNDVQYNLDKKKIKKRDFSGNKREKEITIIETVYYYIHSMAIYAVYSKYITAWMDGSGSPIICKVRLEDFQSIAILLEDYIYIYTCGNSRFTELFPFLSLSGLFNSF